MEGRKKNMNKKGEFSKNPILMLILLAMVIFIGFALITPVTNTNNQMTQKAAISNQTVSTTSAYLYDNLTSAVVNYTIYTQDTWKQTECPLESVSFVGVNGTTWTEDVSYTLYANAGVFSLLNSSNTVAPVSANRTYVSYSFCRDGYITDSGTRSLSGLIATMMVMVLLITAAVVAYEQFNQK